MNLLLIIILHFIIYSAPVFLSSLLSKEFQIYFNYTYLGVLFCLTQIFDSLYSISLGSNFFLTGGDISYSALLFAAIFLIISHPHPKVTRNLIYFNLILSAFLSALFIFFNLIFQPAQHVNYQEFSEILLEFTFRSLFLSFFLFSTEILLQLFILRRVMRNIKKPWIGAIAIASIYSMVLILDGILYPTGINLLFPGSNFSIFYSIFAKVIFGIGFGGLMILYLILFPKKMENFTSESLQQVSFIRYILPPKQRSLLEKYEDAKAEITQLRKILPICSKCKKIRDDEGYWKQLEEYFADYTDTYFSHSYCPDCSKELIDELENF